MTEQIPVAPQPEMSPTEKLLQEAWLKHSKGDDFAAEDDARKALAIDAQDLDAYYLLGLIYRKRNDNTAAIQNFNKAQQLIEAGAIADDRNKRNMVQRMILSQLDFLQGKSEA